MHYQCTHTQFIMGQFLLGGTTASLEPALRNAVLKVKSHGSFLNMPNNTVKNYMASHLKTVHHINSIWHFVHNNFEIAAKFWISYTLPNYEVKMPALQRLDYV